MHAAEDVVVDMLDGQVKVFADVVMGSHDIQQAPVGFIRIAIQHPQPVHPGDGGSLFHQIRQGGMLLPVGAVAGGILGHQDMLPHALLRQAPDFLQNFLFPPGTVVPADQRNGAEGAAVVAPVANAGIGRVAWGGQHPVLLKEIELLLAEGLLLPLQGIFDGIGQALVLVHAHQQVNLGDFLQQALFIALGQAARHHQQAAAPRLLVFGHFQNRVDGFLLGGLDKAAGVHHQHVRLGRVAGKFIPLVSQKAQRGFGVHAVLVAAKGNHANLQAHALFLPAGPAGLRHAHCSTFFTV